jgi:hypothetical protein
MSFNYEPPAITELGTIVEMTRANATGSKLDADFSAGTPVGNLTFS